jgi:hypothetical protein
MPTWQYCSSVFLAMLPLSAYALWPDHSAKLIPWVGAYGEVSTAELIGVGSIVMLMIS